jgi:SAM-dependent methyltransferase
MTADASWTDSMPRIYDATLGPTFFEPFGPLLAAAVAETHPLRVLELAAGTGIATAHLVRALPAGAVTATDLNPAMAEWGRSKVPDADWRVADAQHLTFADESFDAVACQFGVMFFPDKPAAFAEAARVLRPGGAFITLIWDVVETSPMTLAFVESLQTLLGSTTPTFLVRTPHGYTDPDVIAADLRAGGLEPTSINALTLTGGAPDAATIARGLAQGTPTRSEILEHGSLDALTERLAQEMTRRLGEGPVTADLGAFLVRAVRL